MTIVKADTGDQREVCKTCLLANAECGVWGNAPRFVALLLRISDKGIA